MRRNVLALFLASILLSGLSGCKSSDNLPNRRNSADMSSTAEELSDSSTEHTAKIEEYIQNLNNGDLVFVDYEFNEEPKTITDIGMLDEAYDKALTALKCTEVYAEFLEKFANAELFGRFLQNPENYIDESGIPVPILKKAITDDFDCDGAEESFVILAVPTINNEGGEERWFEREYLFFVGENGTELIDDYYNADIQAVLNYGCCKQLIVSSEGRAGVDSKSNIWSVSGGKAVELYGGRLAYKKVDCFLYSEGPQSIGDFAVYDINKNEYLAIQGKTLSTGDVLAMDTTGALNEYREQLESGWYITLLGGKYYLVSDGYFEGIPFEFENGVFVSSNKNVRLSLTPGLSGGALNTLSDVNYDQAVASMVKPEQLTMYSR